MLSMTNAVEPTKTKLKRPTEEQVLALAKEADGKDHVIKWSPHTEHAIQWAPETVATGKEGVEVAEIFDVAGERYALAGRRDIVLEGLFNALCHDLAKCPCTEAPCPAVLRRLGLRS